MGIGFGSGILLDLVLFADHIIADTHKRWFYSDSRSCVIIVIAGVVLLW